MDCIHGIKNIEKIQGDEAFRKPTTRAASKLVNSILGQFAPEGPMLEIGSGLGYLYTILPENYRKRLTQVDWIREATEINRKKHLKKPDLGY
jgi:hypothetical protein